MARFFRGQIHSRPESRTPPNLVTTEVVGPYSGRGMWFFSRGCDNRLHWNQRCASGVREGGTKKRSRNAVLRVVHFLCRLAEFLAVTVFGCATGRCASVQNSALFLCPIAVPGRARSPGALVTWQGEAGHTAGTANG